MRKGIGPKQLGAAKSPLNKRKPGTRAARRRARKAGGTLVESYRYKEGDEKKYLDPVRVQEETNIYTSDDGQNYMKVMDSQNAITNLKTGKTSYGSFKEDGFGNVSNTYSDSQHGTTSKINGDEFNYKGGKVTKNGKVLTEIDPIDLANFIEASANKYAGVNKTPFKMKNNPFKK